MWLVPSRNLEKNKQNVVNIKKRPPNIIKLNPNNLVMLLLENTSCARGSYISLASTTFSGTDTTLVRSLCDLTLGSGGFKVLKYYFYFIDDSIYFGIWSLAPFARGKLMKLFKFKVRFI
jgi:hypothetical protein